LVDGSSRPLSCPHQMAPEIEARVVAMRREHPGWGPRTIRVWLEREGVDPLPGRTSIERCLVRHGLVTPEARKRKRSDYKRWEVSAYVVARAATTVAGDQVAGEPEDSSEPVTTRRVSQKGTISFATATYKAGTWLAGQSVEVVCDGGPVQLHHRGVLVATGHVRWGDVLMTPWSTGLVGSLGECSRRTAWRLEVVGLWLPIRRWLDSRGVRELVVSRRRRPGRGGR
jgi:hypothetical protein